jgi:peptidoglycan/LPS O-acetylase OafA/YrhL
MEHPSIGPIEWVFDWNAMKTIGLALPKIPRRIPHFDELKGIAMVLLLLFHAGGVLVWNNYLHGDLGTDIFFLVSGICLALNARLMKPGEFFTRRLMRVLPGYWIVLTVYVLLNQHFLEHDYSAFNLTLHYLGLHAL